MIPILYESNETEFTSNGLGRLYDCISCIVTEERNGIYECDFEYPITGQNFDKIYPGRIIGCEHDYSDDVQPFDIVSYTRPINGIVTFHAVHISYRQSGIVVSGANINSLSDALTLFASGQPSNPFTYWTDKTSTGYFAAADGVPHSVRMMLGGMEGSILDSYGGEYEFDKFSVKLWQSRGEEKPLTIRYGVNLLDYDEEGDYSETYNSVIPYWTGDDGNGGQTVIKGNRVDSGAPLYNGRTDCVPLDLTEKFETKPTAAQLESMAATLMTSGNTNLPSRSISIDFVRLADTSEYKEFSSLMNCGLCDSVRLVFPRYNVEGMFKIVKTVYNVLLEKYDSIELGNLSTSLASALGIQSVGTFSGGTSSELYPVGSLYATVDPFFDPEIAWGGTWTKLPEGYVLLSGSDSGEYIVGEDSTSSGYNEYGANTRRIEDANIAHGHGFTNPTISVKYAQDGGAGTARNRPQDNGTSTSTRMASASGGRVHDLGTPSQRSNFNVMQKSIAVYWWIRLT